MPISNNNYDYNSLIRDYAEYRENLELLIANGGFFNLNMIEKTDHLTSMSPEQVYLKLVEFNETVNKNKYKVVLEDREIKIDKSGFLISIQFYAVEENKMIFAFRKNLENGDMFTFHKLTKKIVSWFNKENQNNLQGFC